MKILWTDGSAEPNPGEGGFAVIEVIDGKGKPVVLGKEDHSTNIRMEGLALIAAIEYAGEEGCELHTDSQFWVSVLTKWADNWRANGWKKSRGKIKNVDIVKKLYGLYHRYPVELVWEKGHVGIEYNEMADEWANRAREGEEL